MARSKDNRYKKVQRKKMRDQEVDKVRKLRRKKINHNQYEIIMEKYHG